MIRYPAPNLKSREPSSGAALADSLHSGPEESEMRPESLLRLRSLVFRAALPILVCGICAIPASGDTTGSEWRLETRADGIDVHTRAVPGSEIRAFKGESLIEADLETVLAVVRDSDRYQDWFPNCPESRLLRREGAVSYQYSVTAAPWPVDDRDNIFRSTLVRDAETGVVDISITAAPEAYPEQPGRVRVRSARGRWRLEPVDDARTRVLFEMHLDPGGGIPSWMANARVVSTPFEALSSLRRITSP